MSMCQKMTKEQKQINNAKQMFLNAKDNYTLDGVAKICKKYPNSVESKALARAVERAIVRENPLWDL